MFDPAMPLQILNAHVDEATVRIEISNSEINLSTCWIVTEHDGITVINPTAATRVALGDLASLAPRTFVGPIHRMLDAETAIDFPLVLACWWQGGGTPDWVDW